MTGLYISITRNKYLDIVPYLFLYCVLPFPTQKKGG